MSRWASALLVTALGVPALLAALLGLPALGADVPRPVLDGLEAADQRTLSEARQRADSLAAAGGTSDEERAEAWGELGRLYLLHDFVAPAAAAFEEAARLDPEEFAWHYYLGAVHQREGNLEGTRRHFERARALRPRDLPTLLRLAEAALDGSDLGAATTLYQAALAEDPKSAAAHHGLGLIAYEERRWRDAIASFEKALALQPGASSIHHPLGLAYRQLGDLESARRHLELNRHDPVLFADPRMDELASLVGGARPHLKAGTRAAESGDLAGAIQSFQRALSIDPEDPLAHYNLGLALARSGQLEAGIAHFRLAVTHDPDYRDAHYNLAAALTRLGRHLEAAEHYGRAAQLDPLDHGARLEWAGALARSGSFAEAAEAFAITVRAQPDHVEARFGEAMALLLAGEDASARSRLEQGVQRLPESLPLLHALARVLAASEDARVRDPARGLELATRVFRAEPSLVHAETLAMAHAAAGDFGEAAAWQNRAVDEARRRQVDAATLGRLEAVAAGYARGEPRLSPWKPTPR